MQIEFRKGSDEEGLIFFSRSRPRKGSNDFSLSILVTNDVEESNRRESLACMHVRFLMLASLYNIAWPACFMALVKGNVPEALTLCRSLWVRKNFIKTRRQDVIGVTRMYNPPIGLYRIFCFVIIIRLWEYEMRNLICIAKITKDLFLRLVFLDRWRVREAKIVEELTISNILRNLCSSMIIHLGKTCNKSIESENIPILVFDVHKKKQKKKKREKQRISCSP